MNYDLKSPRAGEWLATVRNETGPYIMMKFSSAKAALDWIGQMKRRELSNAKR
ncbi:MAG: hypothetical protein FWG30_11605 [Eubacteriaceae bacterium]|nr:hypothetical protein [Eubacteriaceae bacterium]